MNEYNFIELNNQKYLFKYNERTIKQYRNIKPNVVEFYALICIWRIKLIK